MAWQIKLISIEKILDFIKKWKIKVKIGKFGEKNWKTNSHDFTNF